MRPSTLLRSAAAHWERKRTTSSIKSMTTEPSGHNRGGTARPGFVLSGPATPLRQLAAELWASRRLLALLARKEFFVRYRRASFGVLWAVALPLVQAIVLAAVLDRFVRFDTGNDFVLYVFSGTLGWSFFSASVNGGATSIVDNAEISSKIYFPRALFPLTVIGAGLYGLCISVVLLVAMTAGLAGLPGFELLWYVPAVAALVVLTSSIAVLLAALQVYFRDIKYLVQAALLPMFYVTPIFYPLSAVEALRPYIEANPMTGVVQLFHAGTFGSDSSWGAGILWMMAWSLVLVVAAAWVHCRHDRVLSDLL